MIRFVLAIDDSPERYTELSHLLNQDGILLVCMQNPQAVSNFLQTNANIIAILLDHDMPAVNDDHEIFHDWNGSYYLREVLPTKIPVIITSANNTASPRMLIDGADMGFNIRRSAVTWSQSTRNWYNLIKGY